MNSQKVLTILNVYVLNNKSSENVKQKLIQLMEEIDKPANMVGEINTFFFQLPNVK